MSYAWTTLLRSTYRRHGGGMSRGMRRAREAYLLGNTLIGIALFGFIGGVYFYAISSVKQESFDDVDELALVQSLNAKKSAQSSLPAPILEPTRAHDAKLSAAPLGVSTPPSAPLPRGIVPRVLGPRYPLLLDPVAKTIVWGAPPVDRIGSWGDARK
ncbi:hypothetical protein BKA62DRAFT_397261 [Auriculariales sp. MPI-PUGE-AT-0066]|nr:hypothetical protein BKA62DRAFT_397261 [Auriculariales sp. MPI-PUGE-AT-0066]